MKNVLKLFRYSGSKSKLVPLYRPPPPGTKRLVEPYLGSGAYIMAHRGVPGIGYETNADVAAMWWWLQKSTPEELKDLAERVEAAKAADPEGKPDVRMLALAKGPETYVRINCAGVMTGQLTGWRIYPQNRLPVEGTIQCLPRLKEVEVVLGPASLYTHTDGDLLFVDPPYVGTVGGYLEKGGANHEKTYRPSSTVDLLASTTNPVVFTYGTGAPQLFPSYSWEAVLERKVPNIRSGGTTDRTEWVSYLRWPKGG